MSKYKQSPNVTQPLDALKNMFIRGPKTLLIIFLSPHVWIAFGVWLFGLFMFYFLTGFFLSYIPAKLHSLIFNP